MKVYVSLACNLCAGMRVPESEPEKPRVKGIGEDAFRAIVNEEMSRRGRVIKKADK